MNHSNGKHPLDIARKWVRIILGFSVLLVGIIMIALPGPAVIVIPMGLAILATEYAWARRYLKKFEDGGKKLKHIFLPNKQDKKEDKPTADSK